MSNVSVGWSAADCGGRVPDDDPAAVVERDRAAADLLGPGPLVGGIRGVGCDGGRGGTGLRVLGGVRAAVEPHAASRLARTSSEQAARRRVVITALTVAVPRWLDCLATTVRSGIHSSTVNPPGPVGIDQGLGFDDAALGGDRLEAAGEPELAPTAPGPRPPAPRCRGR